jgi:hypothetical protein
MHHVSPVAGSDRGLQLVTPRQLITVRGDACGTQPAGDPAGCSIVRSELDRAVKARGRWPLGFAGP